MFWPMSFCPKTANALTRPGARGRVSGARRRNPVLQSTGFHQCLGLLKKHTPKTPPARPVSTSIYASKSTSIYTTICATILQITGLAVLCSDRQNPVLRPVPATRIPECAQAVKGWPPLRPPRSGAEPRTAGPSPASMASVLDGRAHGRRIKAKKEITRPGDTPNRMLN